MKLIPNVNDVNGISVQYEIEFPLRNYMLRKSLTNTEVNWSWDFILGIMFMHWQMM